MAEESVIFEIQVDKKVLEQVFNENKHLKDSYEKLMKSEDRINGLKEEIEEMGKKLQKQEEFNRKLIEENARMKKIISEMDGDDNKTLKLKLEKVEGDNKRLDEEKLRLELEMEGLGRKLRLLEEKIKVNELEHGESKLLKLKLQSVENEKNYLVQEFERERKIITKQNKPRMAKLEENLKLLRKWIEKETRERRPRDTDQVKSLKAQIQILENDKMDLIEGFELERRVFQKILRSHGNPFLP